MYGKFEVMEERATGDQGQYTSILVIELPGPHRSPQVLEYNLRTEEQGYKGKMAGKTVELAGIVVRGVFGVMPQIQGRILKVEGNGAAASK